MFREQTAHDDSLQVVPICKAAVALSSQLLSAEQLVTSTAKAEQTACDQLSSTQRPLCIAAAVRETYIELSYISVDVCNYPLSKKSVEPKNIKILAKL
jgi:hypothetical protein